MTSRGVNTRNLEFDRISNLPDDVRIKILSFLSRNDAGRTCVLSKRWRYTWANLPFLEFNLNEFWSDDSDGNRDEAMRMSVARFYQFLNGVLHNREPTKLARVCYGLMNTIALLKLEEIYFFIGGIYSLDIPDFLFSYTSLEHLKMHLYNREKTMNAPVSINLPSLKVLELIHVQLHDDFVKKLFEGCPSLERLEFNSCDLYLSVISSNVLKELTFVACRQFYHTQIFCPGLVNLSMDMFHHEGIQLNNMTSIVNAVFRSSTAGWYIRYKVPVLKLLDGISNTTSLELSLGYPESKKLKKELEKDVSNCRNFINLKKLCIGSWNMSCDFYLVACLLMHSPNLKELTLFPEDSYLKQDITQEARREVLLGAGTFQHEYIETVKIYDGGCHKFSRELTKTLMKTLNRYVKKIGNIVIFS